MNTRAKRAPLAVALALLPTVLLVSCFEQSPQGFFSINVNAGELIVANCGDDIRGPFDVFISELNYPDNWTVLDGESDSAWRKGELRAASPSDWTAVDESNAAEVVAGHQINVFFQNTDESASASFVIPAEGLDEGAWLHHDGAISTSPCSR